MSKQSKPDILHQDVRSTSEQAFMALFQLLLGDDSNESTENYESSIKNNE